MTNRANHIGRNICRIRELRGMKQEALAFELGVSQQTVSNIEKSISIEASLLVQVAEALRVSPEAIENFDEDEVLDIIDSTFRSRGKLCPSGATANAFNTLDKLIEVYEDNKKLYERLLEAEKYKVAYLEKLLKDRN